MRGIEKPEGKALISKMQSADISVWDFILIYNYFTIIFYFWIYFNCHIDHVYLGSMGWHFNTCMQHRVISVSRVESGYFNMEGKSFLFICACFLCASKTNFRTQMLIFFHDFCLSLCWEVQLMSQSKPVHIWCCLIMISLPGYSEGLGRQESPKRIWGVLRLVFTISYNYQINMRTHYCSHQETRVRLLAIWDRSIRNRKRDLSSSVSTDRHVQTKATPNLLSVILSHLLHSVPIWFVLESKKLCK